MSSKFKDLHGSRGKNSSFYTGFIIGIDLGGTKVAGILLSTAGVILARERKDIPVSIDGKALIAKWPEGIPQGDREWRKAYKLVT